MMIPKPKTDEDTNLPYCDPKYCPRSSTDFDGSMHCQVNEWTQSVIRFGQLCTPQLVLDQKRLIELEGQTQESE